MKVDRADKRTFRNIMNDLTEHHRKKAEYCYKELVELSYKYQAVRRRFSDEAYRKNPRGYRKNPRGYRMPMPKYHPVIVCRTPYTRSRTIYVLNGDFDRAVRLVKQLKAIRTNAS